MTNPLTTENPKVMVTLILCGSAVGIALLGIVGWLIHSNRDPMVILNMVNLFISAYLMKRVGDVDGRMATVEKNTNGTNARLLDAVIPKAEN